MIRRPTDFRNRSRQTRDDGLPGTLSLWVAGGLLLLFFLRLADAAALSSATFDEPLHLLTGAVYWQQGHLWPVIDNPLLLQALFGLPQALFFHPALPLDHPFWGESFASPALSTAFLWDSNANGLPLLWAGRLITMLLSLLTGALLYTWSRRWTRAALPALATLLLITFDPNVLAHGNLATTDAGTMLFVCLAAFFFARYWRRPTPALYVAGGIALGLAVGSKFSGAALVLPLALMALYQGWRRSRGWRGVMLAGVELLGWLALAAFVLLAIERFDVSLLAGNLDAVRGAQQYGHRTYLLGALNEGGWWYYFPIIFAAKTPLPVLFLLVPAILVPMWKRTFDWQQGWLLLIAASWVGAAMYSRINVGYRHLLPILPLLYLQVGFLFDSQINPSRAVMRMAAAATAVLAVVSLIAHPDYLAYFNRLAGGPENGHLVAVDSNLDWGQDLPALAEFQRKSGATVIQTALLSTTPPEAYGVAADPLPVWPLSDEAPEYARFFPRRPAAGVYAVSATQLLGVYLADPEMFAYFRQLAPTARVGNAIFIYDVAPDGPPTVAALSGVAMPELSREGYDETIGTNNVTQRWFDARQSLIWSPVEQNWSIVADEHLPQSPLLSGAYPSASHVESISRTDGSSRAAHYFRWPAAPFSELALPEPVVFHDPTAEEPVLELIGRSALPEELIPGAQIELLTVWRMLQAPERPFTLYLHLLDESGNIVAQHDGWGVQPAGLNAGDEVAQLHSIDLPQELPPGQYSLRLGVYELAGGDRFTVSTAAGADDGLTLGVLAVPAP